MNDSPTRLILCVRFEVDCTEACLVEMSPSPSIVEASQLKVRSCGDVDGDPRIYMQHIATVIHSHLEQAQLQEHELAAIAVTTPGAVDDSASTVLRASRLGITSPAPLAESLRREYSCPILIFNDSDCIAMLEHRKLAPTPSAHLVLIAGYGIGSSLLIDGEFYRGAGHAGHLGRAPVTSFWPGGTRADLSYSLEAFSSRVAIAKALRREFQSDAAMSGTLSDQAKGNDTPIERCRDRISRYRNAADVPLKEVAHLLEFGDPSAAHVVDEAARFLGVAVATAIIHINPPVLTCAGELFDELPDFWARVKFYSKRFSWPNAYSVVDLRRGERGSRPQFLGCAILAHARLGAST